MMKKFLLSVWLISASAGAAFAQITVTGTVTDTQGQAVPGVAVTVRDASTRGTITGGDGKYSISVPNASSTLVYFFVGYDTQEIIVGDRKVIDVTLADSSTQMDEVVVIGYGSQVRKNLTGSVSSISGAALQNIPTASVAEALAGKIAGVTVTMADGAPGAEVHFRIRGGTSITQSNDPLFIVDGFPADNINDIPPTDIMSIDILKDASLTAIYGARGGNGVVIVTTKAARPGRVSVNVNHFTKLSVLSRPIEMMDPYQYVMMQYEANNNNWRVSGAFRKNFGSQYDLELYKNFAGHDWQDEILGSNPVSFMHNVSINGGSESTQYSLSATYNDDNGVLTGSGVDRMNVNAKLNINISPKLKLMYNPRLSFRRDMGAGADAVGDGGILDVLHYRPTNGLREFGWYEEQVLNPIEEETLKFSNPKDRISQNYKAKNTNSFQNAVTLEWMPIKNLTLRSNGIIGTRFIDEDIYHGPQSKEGKDNDYLPAVEIKNDKRREYTWQNTIQYNLTMKDHNLSLMGGTEIRSIENWNRAITARHFPANFTADQALWQLGKGAYWKGDTSDEKTPDRTSSFFGQLSYNWASRYLFQATFRADASTRFAKEHRWGYFPAFSAGWVISEENFMKNVEFISFLKLRASLGWSGNNDIDPDLYSYLFNSTASGGPGWGEIESSHYVNAASKGYLPNRAIKWETSLNRSVALDISLFNDRLTITPEVYQNSVRDLLYPANIPSTFGYTQQMQNIAEVTSRGWDLNIEGTILQGQDYYLQANFNVGYNQRTIDKLNGSDRELPEFHDKWSSEWKSDYMFRVGEDVGLIYGLVFDGLYTYDEFNMNTSGGFTWEDRKDPDLVDARGVFGVEPGMPKFKNFSDFKSGPDDYNVIDQNDRVVIGDTTPKANGGFGFSGGWKNWDFSANFTFMLDFDVVNATRYELSSLQSNELNFFNVTTDFSGDKRWRYIGDDAVALTPSQLQEVNAGKTLWHPRVINKKFLFDSFVEDGSFLRAQDITLGYTLPQELTRKVRIERLRFYASAYNLFILTKYTGYDPEVDILSGLTPNMDINKYPRSRNFVFGVNLTF